ncbi:MAG TPA: nucleotidyl transferase AbiEii/AbiGii toxin family protein [Bryobacteraceae bacterium]
MNGKPSLPEIIEVQEYFGLPSPALVEKDWYVMRALAATLAAVTAPFRLIFGGGTALSRAHRLLQRMSEDIDLKIISDEPMTRPALRRLREAITQSLLDAGFAFDPKNAKYRESRNEGRYTIYQLPYTPVAAPAATLRPEIQIETAVWPLRQASVTLPVSSFIAEAYQRGPEIPAVECISLSEATAEKFVALTRRAGALFADAGGPRDPALVRHVYDLHIMSAHNNPAAVISMAREIMLADVEAYGHQFPAYREDPVRETVHASRRMATEPDFERQYEIFVRDMVYGETVGFAEAIKTISILAGRL